MTVAEINQWWQEWGMDAFVPKRSAYQSTEEYILIGLSQIEPPLKRQEIYVDGCEWERLEKICAGFINDDAIPPVQLHKNDDQDSPFTHQLYDGYHRWYAARKAGFTHIPAVIVEKFRG